MLFLQLLPYLLLLFLLLSSCRCDVLYFVGAAVVVVVVETNRKYATLCGVNLLYPLLH